MKRRTFIGLMAAAAAAASLPIGCAKPAAQNADAADSRLVVYLWQNSLLDDLAPYIKSQLPNANIEFIAGNNDVDLYAYLQQHGDLPDIITTRRFSAVDAKNLQPYLIDFASYDIVSEFSPTALQYCRNIEGAIQWLPVCGIPETTIVNKSLLQRLGLAVPRNYDEFAALCANLDALGVKPYACELFDDWACHSILQGAAIDQLESIDGIEWRSQAESSQGGIAFDAELWSRIFDEVETFVRDTRLGADDIARELPEVEASFVEGRAAMFRGTPEVMEYLESNMEDELVRLPYFSQTDDEGWVYTYASLNVALNSALEGNKEKLDAAMGVLKCLVSQEGQRIIAGGSGMISYNPQVPSSLEGMGGIEEEVRNNQFYIRYSSNNSFRASLQAVQGLAGGSMDAAQAFDVFESEMNASKQDERAATFDATYSISPNENGGRDAASSILTTVREVLGADLAFTPYSYYTSSIYQGECTAKQLSLLTSLNDDARLYSANLPGSLVKGFVAEYLATGASAFAVADQYMLPVASGMKLEIRQSEGGFALDGIQVGGAPIDDERVYSIVFSKTVLPALQAADSAAHAEAIEGATLSKTWVSAIEDGWQPAEPEDYIALARER